MSVTAQADESIDVFDDVVQQQVSRVVQLSEGNIEDNEGNLTGGPGDEQAVFEVVGENFWNEVPADQEVIAELMAYRLDFDSMEFRDNNAHTAYGSFHADSNSGLQPGREGNVVDVDPGPQDLDGDGGNEIASFTAQNRNNARFLHETRLSIYPVLFDTVNGAGAGGLPFDRQDTFFMDYRAMFGRGPLVTEADNITMNAEYFANGILGQDNIEHKTGLTLWWDIYARDLPPIRDILAR